MEKKKVEILIDGKAYPCRQTMGAMLRFKQETGKEATEMDGGFTDLCTYLWCCIASACSADKIDFDLSLMEFADAIDPLDEGYAVEEFVVEAESVADFCRLTPTEFEHIYKAYSDKQDADYKDAWGRMRLAATVLLQPHTKRKITPEKVIIFPWEKKKSSAPVLSKEQDKERFEMLMARIRKNQ